MMSCEKEKFPYSFFMLLTQSQQPLASKFTNFHFFIILLPLNVTLFSKNPYLTGHVERNYEIGSVGRFFEKHRHVSRTIARDKMELLVALLGSFQS